MRLRFDDETARRLDFIKARASYSKTSSGVIKELVDEKYIAILKDQAGFEEKKKRLDTIEELRNMIENGKDDTLVKDAIRSFYSSY